MAAPRMPLETNAALLASSVSWWAVNSCSLHFCLQHFKKFSICCFMFAGFSSHGCGRAQR
jgi:hypothetical protein